MLSLMHDAGIRYQFDCGARFSTYDVTNLDRKTHAAGLDSCLVPIAILDFTPDLILSFQSTSERAIEKGKRQS